MNSNGARFKRLTLRRDGKCALCGVELPVGSEVLWNPSQRIVWCRNHEQTESSSNTSISTEDNRRAGLSDIEKIDRGVAGASAMTEHDRRAKKREDRVLAKAPRLGKFFLAITDEPQSTKAWDIGAEDEIAIGKYLDSLAKSYEFLVLHDRLIPKTRSNIDHIAITSSGVYVIDAKHYKGIIQIKDVSGWFSPPDRNYG